MTWIISGVNYLHEIRAAVALLKRFESVNLETSCVMGYHALEKVVDECGDKQILFGSAAPLQHLGANLEKVANSDYKRQSKRGSTRRECVTSAASAAPMRFVRFIVQEIAAPAWG